MTKFLFALSLLCLPAAAAADEILAWDRAAQAIVKAERLPADSARQTLEMVRAAVDDAVSSAAPLGGSSGDIAAAVAAHGVLSALFPSRRAALDRRLNAVRTDLPDGALE